MAKIDLIIIDPQYDFCASADKWQQQHDALVRDKAPASLLDSLPPKPALSVPGADDDMERVGQFIARHRAEINELYITLDSHQDVHIAHPVFWRDINTGQHPAPFTQIKASDVGTRWTTNRPSESRYGAAYVEELEKGGRYPLVIWPPHCLIGTIGQTVYAPVQRALRAYCEQFKGVNYVTKGSNPYTEHYSAIRAEVNPTVIHTALRPGKSYPTDPSVGLNVPFLEAVNSADKVLICGEAGSHCLANTFRDADQHFKGAFAKKLVLLKDGTSPVPGFESAQDQFIQDMVAQGMEVATTDTFTF